MLFLTQWLDGYAAHDAQGRFRGFAKDPEAAKHLAHRDPLVVGQATPGGGYVSVPGQGLVWKSWWEAKGRRLPRTSHPGGTLVEGDLYLDMRTGELYEYGPPEEVVMR